MLLDDGTVVAAAACRSKNTADPIQHRVHTVAMWAQNIMEGWIVEHKIKELGVNIETPVLNVTRKNVGDKCPVCKKPLKSNDKGVTTLMKQVRLLTALEEMLFRIEGCEVMLGEVHNQTVKNVFAGTGKACKTIMVNASVWAKRPDVKDREHLADAQGIGTVRPIRVPMMEGELLPRPSTYEDHAVGVGKDWKGKR